MKVILDRNLLFILALYEDGSFQKGTEIDDGFVMLIDLGKWRNTIMSNPNSTPDAIKAYGYHWEEFTPSSEGTDLIVDDDFVVHHGVKATEEDFENVKEGLYAYISIESPFFYMDRKGDFKYL